MRRKYLPGLTLVEAVVVLVLVGILIVPVTILSVQMLSAMFDRSSEAMLASEAQSTLRTISEDFRTANTFLPSTSITDSSLPGIWHTSSSNGRLVFNSIAQRTDQSIITDGSGDPLYNEFVYHKVNEDLYKRSLPVNHIDNATIRTCPVNSAVATCPPDAKLTSHLKNLSFTFYNGNSVTADPTTATSIVIDLTLSNSSLEVVRSMRITKRSI